MGTELLHLSKTPAEQWPHIVVLCGDDISPSDVFKRIDGHPKLHLYDGEAESKGGLAQWLESPGGLLVTSNQLFAGMEAPVVIFITKSLGPREPAVRSGMLRAVSKLVVITDKRDANINEIEKYFNVVVNPSVSHQSLGVGLQAS